MVLQVTVLWKRTQQVQDHCLSPRNPEASRQGECLLGNSKENRCEILHFVGYAFKGPSLLWLGFNEWNG
jgi:hypothetical protein